MDRQQLRRESLVRTRAERLLDRFLVKDLTIQAPTKRIKVDEQTEARAVQTTIPEALDKVLKYINNPLKTKKCIAAASKLTSQHSEAFELTDISRLINEVIGLNWDLNYAEDLDSLIEVIGKRPDIEGVPDFKELQYFTSALKGLSTDDSHAFPKQVQSLHDKLIAMPSVAEEADLSKRLFLKVLRAASKSFDWKKTGLRSLAKEAYKLKMKFSQVCADGFSELVIQLSARTNAGPEILDPALPKQPVSDGRAEVLCVDGLDSWANRQLGLSFKKD
jgi:hypothetical protein